MDIKDFDIGWFEHKTAIIGVAKHLCGGATDLTICSFKLCKHLKGLAIATCCHHKCDIKTYVNMPFMQEELGVKAEEFQAFVRCSSYASYTGDNTDKRRAGFMVKRLVDLGRLLWINNELGLKAKGV